jgi:hypothetical protein
MTTIKATVAGGRLELDVPADWPDGTQVEIHPAMNASGDDSMSPEEIADVLMAMDRLEPLNLTEAERAAWEAQRQAAKDLDKRQFADRARKLKGMWE